MATFDRGFVLPRDWKTVQAIDQKNRKPGLILKKRVPGSVAVDRRANKYKKQRQGITLAKHA